MAARLIPLAPGTVPTITLQRPVILVGRHPECDVRLDLPEISKRHCCLAMAYDRLMVRDLGSRNGVRVNGRLVDEWRIQPGDEIAIAHILYRLEDTGTTRPVRPGAPAATATSGPPSPPDLPTDLNGQDIELIPLDEDE